MSSPVPRRSPLRDRRDRGSRGPDLQPGPLTPNGVPAHRTRAQRFDLLAMAVYADVRARNEDRLPPLELAVEDVPIVPPTWRPDQVPLCSLVQGTGAKPSRLVLFRRPVEHRAESVAELTALVLTVICDQLAQALACRPEDLHPDYPVED